MSKSENRPPVRLPTVGGSGLQPGVELDDSAGLLDRMDLEDLTVAERILLAQDLWDSVAGSPEVLELTDAQRAELERRLAEYRKDPQATIPWAVLRKKLLDGL